MTKTSGLNFGGMQNEIYNAGLNGHLPEFPVDFATLEKRAHEALGPSLTNYVAGGCGDEHTQDSNSSAFHHWGMVPRMMVDCSERDLSIELFG
ncbi:MAG: alpha-hydroxy-acid oxidizing protein, partial [Pseudomonadota bacterium]